VLSRNCLITFKSVHQVMKVEEILNKNNISVDIMPLPRKISDSCVLGLVFPKEDLDKVKILCNTEGLEFKNVYLIDSGNITLFES